MTKRARGSLSPPSRPALYGKAVARARRAFMQGSEEETQAQRARARRDNIIRALQGQSEWFEIKLSGDCHAGSFTTCIAQKGFLNAHIIVQVFSFRLSVSPSFSSNQDHVPSTASKTLS